MLRELVGRAARAEHGEQPLALVLEDLHWSDASTVEVLALLARRRETARLLVLGKLPVEVLVHAHPLHAAKQERWRTGRAVELPLGGLGPAAVAANPAQRKSWPGPPREAVAAVVYRRTEGHPRSWCRRWTIWCSRGPLPRVGAGAAGEGLDWWYPRG